MQMSMFSSEEPLASLSALQDSERDWTIRVVTSCLPMVQLLNAIAPNGWYLRMSPASCHLTEEGTLEPSSGCWANSGMGSPTGFLTLNSCEHASIPAPFPSDEGVCSLSDVLETGEVPQRFFLTAKACQGLLNRAEKRNKKMPISIYAALKFAAQLAPETTKTPAQIK